MGSKIEWTDETWNPLAGCTPVSEGCRHCYAARDAVRLEGNPNKAIAEAYAGTAEMRGAGDRRRAVFTGRVNLLHHRLDQPLRWKRPRRIFVNSMSDLFHEAVPVGYIRLVLSIAATSSHHTHQILTKRPERARAILENTRWAVGFTKLTVQDRAHLLVLHALPADGEDVGGTIMPEGWSPPNLRLGTSVEGQSVAHRIDELVATPVASRFLSCEPFLEPLRLGLMDRHGLTLRGAGLHQVIAGGESGHHARPMHPWWVTDLRDECKEAGVPFFFKQWGAWAPAKGDNAPGTKFVDKRSGEVQDHFDDFTDAAMVRVGKKVAGRLLEGVEYNEEPKPIDPAWLEAVKAKELPK